MVSGPWVRALLALFVIAGPATVGTQMPAGASTQPAASEHAFGATQLWSVSSAFGVPFSGPKGVDVDLDGNVYVADTGNDRIVRLDGNGTPVDDPRLADPAADLSGPQAIGVGVSDSVDSPPPVFVADTQHDRVRVVDAAGAWSTFDLGEGITIGKPAGLSFRGGLQVADTEGKRMLSYFASASQVSVGAKPAGMSTGLFGTSAGFPYLRSILADPTRNWLLYYAGDGSFKRTYGGPGDGPGQFNHPEDTELTAIGAFPSQAAEIHVADTGNHRVQRLQGSAVNLEGIGKGVQGLGGLGSGLGQFDHPGGIAQRPGNERFAVADTGNDRIELWEWTDASATRPRSIQVQRLAAGTVKVRWAAPLDAAAASVNRYVVDVDGHPATCEWTGGPSECTLSGLSDGSSYRFGVQAFAGTGFGQRATADAAVVNASELVPLVPSRIVDSRNGTGGFSSPWGSGERREVQVTGTGGVPASGVSAVVLNVTVTDATAPSHLTLWPSGSPMPTVSSVNFLAGETRANAVTVAVGTNGRIAVFNNAGDANVIVDVAGYYDDGSGGGHGFVRLSPARIVDSRIGTGGFSSPWGPAVTRGVSLTGSGGVPVSGVSAVVLNVTVTGPTAPSHLTLWPNGAPMPTVSNLNFLPGDTRANAVTVAVGAGGAVSVFNNAGNVQVIIDVAGYYDATGGGKGFVPLAPSRIVDSRHGTGGFSTPWLPTTTRAVDAAGSGGVPSDDVSAVVANVTATNPTSASHLTVWPHGESMPTVSNLNVGAGETRANAVITAPFADVYNNAGSTDVIIDVYGYFLA